MGWFSDGVYSGATSSTGSSVELTSVFSAQAAYEHFWTPALRTSLAGGYTSVRYSDTASTAMCLNLSGTTAVTSLSNCGSGSFNWSHWSLSSRTQWNITRDFYIGLEQYYGRLNTMSKGQTISLGTASTFGQPTGTRTLDDQNVWVTRFRVHRDITP